MDRNGADEGGDLLWKEFCVEPSKLAELGDKAGLTQEGLAERAGVHRDTVSPLERGQRPGGPHPATARRLAHALGMEISEFASNLRQAWHNRDDAPPDVR